MHDWIHLDLRCYTCDTDLFLVPADGNGQQRLWYCSRKCSNGLALSDEIVTMFKLVIERLGIPWLLDHVGSLAVADAMLEPHPMRGSGRPGQTSEHHAPRAERSYQWRTIRLQQLETLVPA